MLGVVLGMVAVALSSPTAAAPTAPPLKIIVHARASAFCTTVRENVGHAMGGLLQNDNIMSAAKPLYIQMARDYYADPQKSKTGNNAWLNLDEQRMREMIGSIVHNLAVIDRLLADEQRIPSNPRTDEDRALNEIKQELVQSENAQRDILNVLEGSLDTYDFQALRSIGNGLNGALGPQGGGAEKNLVFSCDGNSPDCSNDPAFKAGGMLFANNPFGHLFDAVSFLEQTVASREGAAAKSIMLGTSGCGN